MSPEREQQLLDQTALQASLIESLQEQVRLYQEQVGLQDKLIRGLQFESRKHEELDARREQDLVRLRQENELLRRKLDLVLRKLFGKSSETLDPAQLELLLGEDEPPGKAPASTAADAPEEAAPSVVEAKRKPRRERIPDHLPVVEEILEPEPVKACPDAWRRIGQETSDTLDYQPARIFIRRLVRPVYVRRDDREAAPLVAKFPPRLQDGLTAAPGLIAQVVVSKYCDHLPFHRQQRILETRHGVSIGRNTLCRWDDLAAFWLEPLHRLIHEDLLQSPYLQADETPVKYLDPGKGRTSQGYFWLLNRPHPARRAVFFQWHPGRGRDRLDRLLPDYRGILQTDAYTVYGSYQRDHPGLVAVGCWAHVRRKFHEALVAGQLLAAGPLKSIAALYRVESALRETGAGADERARARREQSGTVIEALHRALNELAAHCDVLPKSPLGAAIRHALDQWPKLLVYLDHGEVEIDNNLCENQIRPTAIGKKNWLFVGREDSGAKAAILYTLIGTARLHGIEPYAYLKDLLERLPAMKSRDLESLLPWNWQPGGASQLLQAAS